MSECLKNFYKSLKKIRLIENKSQRAVAKAIGITPQSYRAYELGLCYPTMENFIKLCLYFDLTPNEMLDIEE